MHAAVPGETSLWRSLEIQVRVIAALTQREIITRYGRHNIGFLWLFFEPIMFTLGVVALWSAFHSPLKSDIPIVAFAMTGYSTVLLWRNGASRTAKAIEPNMSLLHHRNVFVFDIFIARVLLEVAGATVAFVVLSTVFSVFGWMDPPVDIPVVVAAWFLLIWFSMALAFIVGALSERYETVERVWHPLSYFMLPLSGAMFMVEWLPQAAQDAVLWVPIVHGVEMLRHGYLGPWVTTHEDPAYLIVVNLVLTLVGLALMRETARRVEPE
jgi:capsular polysaccharide transport system permease protein